MSIRVTYTEAKLNLDVGYQTTCKSCGTSYAGTFCCSLDSGLRQYSQAGEVVQGWANNLAKGLAGQLARGERATRCPKCRAIDPTAQARFGEDDAGGLVLARFKYYVLRSLFALYLTMASLILSAFLMVEYACYFSNSITYADNPAPRLMTVAASAAIVLLVSFCYGYAPLTWARKAVAELSEEEAEELLDILYFESGEDLRLWALASNSVGFKRHARPWLPKLDVGGGGYYTLQSLCFFQHYPPLPILRGGKVSRLRQAISYAQDKSSYYATGARFPRPPEATRVAGGPGQWNWCYGHGTLLLSRTPASKEAESALQNILQELRVLDQRKLVTNLTVVTVRMKPQTREWGVLIVNPRPDAGTTDKDAEEILGEETPMADDFPLPFVALEHHHPFARIAMNPRKVQDWVQSFSQQVIAPMEFADEQRILVV